jgi:hypothetical protein
MVEDERHRVLEDGERHRAEEQQRCQPDAADDVSMLDEGADLLGDGRCLARQEELQVDGDRVDEKALVDDVRQGHEQQGEERDEGQEGVVGDGSGQEQAPVPPEVAEKAPDEGEECACHGSAWTGRRTAEDDRESKGKDGLVVSTFVRHRPAVVRRHAPDDREAEASARWFRGEERIEYRHVGRREAGAVILDLDRRRICLYQDADDDDRVRPSRDRRRVERVRDEVLDGGAHEATVGVDDRRGAGFDVDARAGRAFGGYTPLCFENCIAEIDGAEVHFGRACEDQEVLEQRVRAEDLSRGLTDRVTGVVEPAGSDLALGEVELQLRAVERVPDLVREPRAELGDRDGSLGGACARQLGAIVRDVEAEGAEAFPYRLSELPVREAPLDAAVITAESFERRRRGTSYRLAPEIEDALPPLCSREDLEPTHPYELAAPNAGQLLTRSIRVHDTPVGVQPAHEDVEPVEEVLQRLRCQARGVHAASDRRRNGSVVR